MIQSIKFIMSNICFVVTSMSSGGAERNVSILANNFVRKGHSVSIILLFNDNVFYELDKNIKLISFKKNKHIKLFNILKWKKEIRGYVINNKIDIVIAVGIKYGIISAYSLYKIDNVKLIVRGTNTYNLSILETLGVKFFGKRINTFVCQTKSQYESMNNTIKKRAIIISNPFNVKSENFNKNGFESKKIICVARLNIKSKHQDVILKAFSLFKKSEYSDGFKLYFYGADNSDGKITNNLIKLADKLGLNKSDYEFCGAKKDISKFIENSFCFICASSEEGMPNAMIESLLYGIPVITSNWTGHDEIIYDNINGFIYNNCLDYNMLSQKMIKLSQLSKEDYLKLSNNSCSYLVEKYHYDDVLTKWAELLN